MNESVKYGSSFHASNVLDSMQERRATRALQQEKMDRSLITELMDAAIHGVQSVEDPLWLFVVIQDERILKRICNQANAEITDGDEENRMHPTEVDGVTSSKTLIAICGKPVDHLSLSDGWQTGRNLMVAAAARGLDSMIFRHSVSILNRPDWKSELLMSNDMDVIVPIMLSQPHTGNAAHRHAEIISWNGK